MSISVISDLHITSTSNNDESFNLLKKFISNPLVMDSTDIILLGDIFDLMVGNHIQYSDEFKEYFDQISSILDTGKNIYYIEGNHDFHLIKLYKKLYGKRDNLHVLSDGFFINRWGMNFYFTHGDDIEIGNYAYKAYKFLVRSFLFKFIANNIPYNILKNIGSNLSNYSREKNVEEMMNNSFKDYVKSKFRQSAIEFKKKNCNINYIISGHSHIKDYYVESDFTYINNGYAPISKSFIYIDKSGVRFEEINY